MTIARRILGAGTALLLASAPALAADWFGLPLPTGLSNPLAPTILIGKDAQPLPLSLPNGETRFSDLRGERIRGDLEQIVGISRQSRLNGDKMWGRIAGLPSLISTVEWSATQFRNAGIGQVAVEKFTVSQPLWLPKSWSMRVHGPGPDIVLETAFPQRNSPTIPTSLTAPLVFAGTGTAAELAGKSITDKVVVLHKKPDPGLYHSRGGLTDVLPLRPAAIVFVVEGPGNMQSFDSCTAPGVPCFYVGGQDGQFLEAAINAAARAGGSPLQMSIQLETTTINGATAANAVAIVPGKKGSGENIIVNAHADAFFEGASDNGDGLAVLIALARHFALPQHRPDRTLVFIASAGHHTPGGNGGAAFVAAHPEIVGKTVFVLNLEHIAQMNMSTYVSAPSGRAGYRDLVADTVEYSQYVGITMPSPFLFDVFGDAARIYGKNVFTRFDATAPGDLGGYAPVQAPRAQLIHATEMYHTTGDVIDTISTVGLERAAHFFEYVVRKVDAASTNAIYGR